VTWLKLTVWGDIHSSQTANIILPTHDKTQVNSLTCISEVVFKFGDMSNLFQFGSNFNQRTLYFNSHIKTAHIIFDDTH